MQRTTECVFIDWNPSEDFWFNEQGFEERGDCIIIDSNFYDNIRNLTEKQLRDLKEAKRKAEAEEARGQRGYWWNWWQVYGLGKKGRLEGVIFNNWKTCKEIPNDEDFFHMWCIDWGGADPTTYTELWFSNDDRLFIKEHIYQSEIRNSKLIDYILETNQHNDFVICDSARKDKIYELQISNINADKCRKYPGVKLDNIDSMQEFIIFITENSKNAINEFTKYKRIYDEKAGRFLEQPEDGNDHIIDAVGYAVEWYRRMIRPLK